MLSPSSLRCVRSIAGVALLAALAISLAPAIARAAEGADGRFDDRRSAHFLLREDVAIDRRTGPQGAKRFQHDVLETLERGYDLLDDTLGLRPRRRIEVEIYDPQLFDARFAGLFPFPAAGFYGGVIRVRGDVQVTAQLASTLHHELVHAALDAAAPSLAIPIWLNEGLAEWFAARAADQPAIGPRRRAVLADGAQRGLLLPLAAISEPSLLHLAAEDAPLAYLQSTALVDQVVQRGGERALREVLALYLRTGDLDRALLRATGLDANGLEASAFAER